MPDDDDFEQLIRSALWYKLTKTFSPSDFPRRLSFRDALRVAYRLLYNDSWDEDLQIYATKLLEAIRIARPSEWNTSWQYDALLGFAYYLICEHEKRYEAYKRSFEKNSRPPARLLIEMARCAICPGDPPIRRYTAIELAKKTLEEGPFIDGMGVLCSLYGAIDDTVQKDYWKNVLKKADKTILSPSIEPDFLGDEYFYKERGIKGFPTLEKSSIFHEQDAEEI